MKDIQNEDGPLQRPEVSGDAVRESNSDAAGNIDQENTSFQNDERKRGGSDGLAGTATQFGDVQDL